MLSRVNGIQHKKAHLYKDLPILDKEIFYTWALNNDDFNRLFDMWELELYKRISCPSIDRIDSSKGYTLDNIRWITFRENCILGNKSKKMVL